MGVSDRRVSGSASVSVRGKVKEREKKTVFQKNYECFLGERREEMKGESDRSE